MRPEGGTALQVRLAFFQIVHGVWWSFPTIHFSQGRWCRLPARKGVPNKYIYICVFIICTYIYIYIIIYIYIYHTPTIYLSYTYHIPIPYIYIYDAYTYPHVHWSKAAAPSKSFRNHLRMVDTQSSVRRRCGYGWTAAGKMDYLTIY